MSMVECSGGCGRRVIAAAATDGTWTCFACYVVAQREALREEYGRKLLAAGDAERRRRGRLAETTPPPAA
jgi:hypothetical protein